MNLAQLDAEPTTMLVLGSGLLPSLSKTLNLAILWFSMTCKFLIFNDAKMFEHRHLDFFDSLSCTLVFGLIPANATFQTKSSKMGQKLNGKFSLDYPWD